LCYFNEFSFHRECASYDNVTVARVLSWIAGLHITKIQLAYII